MTGEILTPQVGGEGVVSKGFGLIGGGSEG